MRKEITDHLATFIVIILAIVARERNMPEQERILSISGNSKGLPCLSSRLFVRRATPRMSNILDWQKAKGTVRSGYETENKGFRVQQWEVHELNR